MGGFLALVAVFAADPLPEGDAGIAAGYEDDVGIEGDADVILFEDFEGYSEATELDGLWEAVHHYDQIRFATGDVLAGEQSLQLTVPQQDAELANGLTKWVAPELDALFLRYYSKFDAPYDVVGSSHDGSMISAHYFDGFNATPGVPADGTNKWLVNFENWRGEVETPSPGFLNMYVYHPEQRSNYGDIFYPTGLVSPNTSLPYDFGPDFVPFDDVVPELERWYCFELMVVANTPGTRDGRIAAWLDGVLVADFPSVRLRDVAELTIDRFGIGFHIGSNPNGETHKWYDNVVAAHSYIGPMFHGDVGSSSGSSESGEPPQTTSDSTGSPEGDDDSADTSTPDSDPSSGGSTSTSTPPPATGDPGGTDTEGCSCAVQGSAAAPMLLLLAFARRRRPRA